MSALSWYAAALAHSYVPNDKQLCLRVCHQAADWRSALPVTRRSDSDTTASHPRPSHPIAPRTPVGRLMSRISAFHGIVIWMYHDEPHHTGRSHFHASCAGHEATVDIEDQAILAGRLPPRDHRLVN